MNRSGRAFGALLLGALVATGCAGSEPRPTSPTTTTTAEVEAGPETVPDGPAGPPASFAPGARSGANPPAISGYEVPASVPCTPGQPATVPVSYQTTGAMTVTFTVGTTQVEGYPPVSGTFGVPVPCDGNAHTIVIFAVATDMSTNTASKAVIAGP